MPLPPCPVLLMALQIAAATAEEPQPRVAIDVGAVRIAGGCPEARDVTDALSARLPGAVAGGGGPGAARLRLDLVPADEGGARLTLTDAGGTLVLERILDLASAAGVPPRERGDCAALADTVALIVERYARHIGYRERPPPAAALSASPLPTVAAPRPPPAPPMIGAGLAVRPGRRGPWRNEPGAMVEVHAGRLAVSASLAFTPPVSVDVPDSSGGTFRLMAFPARVAAGWVIPLGRRAWLAPTVAAGADLVLARTESIGTTQSSTAVEPVGEAGGAATLALGRRAWLRLQALQGVDLRPEQFVVGGGVPPQQQVVFMTPRLYVRVGLDFGLFLFPR